MINPSYSKERPVVDIIIPAKHMMIRLVRPILTILLGSRGSLKTTFGLAMYCIDMIYEMPRSTGVIVVPNYEHFELNTLTPLLKGWSNLGYRIDEHFVMDRKPPEHWPKSYDYNGEKEFSRTICWHNGTMIKVVSLARLGASNAISAQWLAADEVKLMKKVKLDEVFPILRGNEQYFEHSSCYLSKFLCTDKLADPAEIAWLLDYRNQNDIERAENIAVLQERVNLLRNCLPSLNKRDQDLIKIEIHELEKLLKEERNNFTYVFEINCYDVLPILGERWLAAAKELAKTRRVWEVAYENKDPDKPAESFYPDWNEDVHLYESQNDDDINLSLPLITACDYQHSISPMPIAQISKLPGEEKPSLNYIDYIYGLSPETLKSTVKKMCEKYSSHLSKHIFFVYDQTAIGRRVDADEYKEIVVKELVANDWTVTEIYTGQAPLHFQKYSDTQDWLQHGEGMEDELEIRMHKVRCYWLNESIKNAGAKTERGITKKEKKYEDTIRFPDADQRKATHGSDTFDMINDAVMKQKIITIVDDPIPLAFR